MSTANTNIGEEQLGSRLNNAKQWALVLTAMLILAVLTAIGVKGLAGQRWVFVVAAIGTPIVAYGMWTRSQFSTYLAIFLLYTNMPVVAMKFHGVPYFIAAAVPGLLLIPLGHSLLFRREKLIFPPATMLVLSFVIVQALSTLFSSQPETAMSSLFRSLTQGIAVFALLVNAVRTPDILRGATWALIAGGALMGTASIHQYATGSYDSNYGGLAQLEDLHAHGGAVVKRSGDRRTAGTVGEKNRFAQNMLMLLPIALFCCLAERSTRTRILAATIAAITMFGWAVAFSRGCAVALALTAVVGVLIGCFKLRHLAIVSLAAFVILLCVPRYQTRLASLAALTGVLESKQTLAHTADGSIRGRFTEMLAASRVFADHPLLGVGPSVFPYYAREYGKQGGLRALETKRQAHNLYLGIAAEQGILGLLCFLGIVGMTLRDLLCVRRKLLADNPRIARLASGYALALIGYLASGLFLHFSFVRFFWLILGLATATVYVARRWQAEHPDSANDLQPLSSIAT
jgi:O-Antigen ligase